MKSIEDFARELDWNLLKIFHEIVQAGGITKASDRTHLKQSAISLALQRLETRIGAVLCKRGSAGFELTPEGILLAELCAPIMRAVREIPSLANESSSEVHGNLTIGLISNFTCSMLDAAISLFHARFPNVELIVSTMPSTHVTGSVMRNEIDIGVAPSRVARPELRYRFLSDEIHRPYCGVNHRLFGEQFVDPRQLQDERFVLTGSDEPDELRAFRLQYGLGDKVSAVTEHLEEAKRFAILGIGLCFLPENYASADEAEGRLWPLLPREIAPSIGVYVIDNPSFPQLARRNKLREGFIACLK
jgi:DNA-binding transcriptional LysR family regulator